MGIGGGFLMTIFSKETGKVETLNARETAPGAATKNMYHGDEKTSEKGTLQFYSCHHESRLCIHNQISIEIYRKIHIFQVHYQ